MSKYRYIPFPGGGETPVLETLNATQNGQYLPEEGVTGWNEVNIDVPASEVDSGTKQVSITQNGTTTEDVTGYTDVEIDVNVQPNLQSKTVTQNGLVEPDQDYDGLSDVDVQVPASEVDTGTKQVSKTQNGTTTEDVVGYASIEIDVQVPASAVDTGTKQTPITTNGTQTIDVVGYANHEVDVNVPASAVDTGTKQVSKTQNGTTTENVVGYASIEIDVQVPAPYWSGTQAQYDALPSYSNDMLYLIIN